MLLNSILEPVCQRARSAHSKSLSDSRCNASYLDLNKEQIALCKILRNCTEQLESDNLNI